MLYTSDISDNRIDNIDVIYVTDLLSSKDMKEYINKLITELKTKQFEFTFEKKNLNNFSNIIINKYKYFNLYFDYYVNRPLQIVIKI